MEIIKRKINLEDGFSRKKGPLYGTLTADTFYVKISLTQNIDDMGIYATESIAEAETEPDYTILKEKLEDLELEFPFMTGATIGPYTGDTTDVRVSNSVLSDYFVRGDTVTGSTDSKKEYFRSYDLNAPYIIGFDINKTTYDDPFGNNIIGRSRITNDTPTTTTYVFDANNDINIGTTAQTSGLLYIDDKFLRRSVDFIDNNNNLSSKEIYRTDFSFESQGFNETNVILSGIVKNEYLLGITDTPKIENDIFIDRGNTSVFDKHMKLSGIFSVQQLEQFGNGEFNIIKK